MSSGFLSWGVFPPHASLSLIHLYVVHYINFSLSAFYYFTIQHERESKKMKRENHQNVRELTVQLEDWDRGWTDALENGKHWLSCIPLRSTFISECSRMAAGQSLTCLNHPRRTRQWRLSCRNINMNSTRECRTPKNKEGQESPAGSLLWIS